jgi:hypothetical protein
VGEAVLLRLLVNAGHHEHVGRGWVRRQKDALVVVVQRLRQLILLVHLESVSGLG